ncbi:MAG: ribosome biogenesis GTPase Der [Actinomycetia bacterium]|nr:ribosome biogenesis GTPase Der [Actinomycetes bacterium]
MSLPIVAVVGRPNVGKSTFVNRISMRSEAIVHEQRGVTRDRSYHRTDWNGRDFMLIDTGGIELGGGDAFQGSIRRQAMVACEEADVVLFMVDGQGGLTADDLEVAKLLKRSKRPVLLLVNKLDNPGKEEGLWEFMQLGLGEPWPVSSVHGYGTGDLLDAVLRHFPAAGGSRPEALAGRADADDDVVSGNVEGNVEGSDDDTSGVTDDDTAIPLAIIGRPNVGKSTLTNRLVGSDRSIVSEVAGTTRDAIDSLVEREGQRYRIIDTAGIRKKSRIDEDVEYYGFVRALRAIDDADVALMLIDATVGLTDQDQRVARLADERSCALIILLNKWDQLADAESREWLMEQITDRLAFVSYAPVLPISALTGQGTQRIWPAVSTVYANFGARFSTSRLNALLTELRDFGHTINRGRMRLRVNYVTQTGTNPPAFTFFANHPQIIDDNYRRYLENRLRAALPLEGTPVHLRFKKKD